MKRVSNRNMRPLVAGREEFENNNYTVFGKITHHGYVVFSYGTHFPMYYYDNTFERWFGNQDRYSSTMTQHQSACRPVWETGAITWVPTGTLVGFVTHGVLKDVAQRMSR